MSLLSRTALATALALAATSVQASDDWFFRVGATHVNPDSDNGTLAGTLRTTVDSNTQIGLTIGRYLDDHWAIEVLAATPFRHTASLNGAEAVDLKHLPPTVSLQYYFGAADAAFRPFVGAGLNHTIAFDIEERGPVAGTRIDLDSSWGLAAQAGLLFKTGDWDVVADVRWIDIGLDAQLNGADIGTVDVDPLVFSVMVGTRF
jgi:outer membrane protein